jgi:hypothetical protein
MAKVVKAFSVDYDLAQYIDSFPAGTRSEHVNWALRSYFFSTAGGEIDYQRALADMWKDKALSRGGVKHHLKELLKALFRSKSRR